MLVCVALGFLLFVPLIPKSLPIKRGPVELCIRLRVAFLFFFFSEPCQECRFSKLSVGQPDVLFQLTNCRMIFFFFFSIPFRNAIRADILNF